MSDDNKRIVLISLIGKGQQGDKGYRKAEYFFDETQEAISTSFFGSALYRTLKKLGHNIEQWIIFGTAQSNWSELLSTIEDKLHDKAHPDNLLKLWEEVYQQEKDGISEKLLKEWESLLQNDLPGVRLLMVDPLKHAIYLNTMLNEVTDKKCKVVLDITHSFRHMPVMIAFSLMVLRYIKNISDVTIYYVAFDMKYFMDNPHKDYVPVIKIEFGTQLISLAESLATFNDSAYFVDLLSLMDIPGTDDTYFLLEMNRQPRSKLTEITQKLNEISEGDDYRAAIARYLHKEIKPLLESTLDKRMVERAKFFFARKQYLKALILLYEGMIIGIGRKHGFTNYMHYGEREQIRSFIKSNTQRVFMDQDQKELFYKIEYTRNAAVHGSVSRGTQDTLEKIERFEELFVEGVKLYDSIV